VLHRIEKSINLSFIICVHLRSSAFNDFRYIKNPVNPLILDILILTNLPFNVAQIPSFVSVRQLAGSLLARSRLSVRAGW